MSDSKPTPGQRLKAEREKRGMSLDKAAKGMHLEASAIQALEAGEYERFGPLVYAKGHLRRYAKMLGLPVDEIMMDFEPVQITGSTSEGSGFPVGSKHSREPAPGVSPVQLAASLAAAVALIGLAWWQPWQKWQHKQPATAATAASAPAAEVPAPAAVAGLDPNDGPPDVTAENYMPQALAGAGTGGGVVNATLHNSAAIAAGVATPGVATPGAQGPGVQSSGAAGSAAAPAASAGASAPAASPRRVAAAPAPPRARLRLSFTSDSWVDVRDAQGNKAFVGNGSANTVKTIAGAAPLHVLLRSASGVQLEINGRAVAIGPQFFSGDVARFEAGADGVLRREQASSRPPG